MSQKFQSSIQHRADVSYVKLGGVIDEDNELADLAEKIPTGTAVIDLGEIERINSCGVRDWVNWLSKLENNGTRSVLVECSPAIVAQINLVNNFTGNGVVKSFYVPYFCPECDEEKVLLVETTDMGASPHEPPTCRCDECDLVMDFDDMPDSYFAFLSNQKKLVEPERLDGAMRDLVKSPEPETVRVSKVRSRVSQPNLSNGSKPSVPSLPSIQRTHASGPAPIVIPPSGGHAYPSPASRPPLAAKPTGPSNSRPPLAMGQANHMGHMAQVPQAAQIGHLAHQVTPMGQVGHVASGPHVVSSHGFGFAAPGQGHVSGPVSAMRPPVAAPPRTNLVVYLLIAILMAAIGVLAYLVLTK
ncbi:MAG TPA: hypothetical protein VHN14_19680 [Kofleriaceae bacterium]|jgi:anti-anti-sigma regulatory factor|nr:hypothetical protein [Kofleriaceae bacterium]